MQSELLTVPMRISQRVVMISGANRGIGFAIARRLLNDGHRISLGMRDPDQFRSEPANSSFQASESIHLHAYDANNPQSAANWVQSTLDWAGAIDALIHCAGILRTTPLLFTDDEADDLDSLWRINVMGPWWLTRAAWPQLSQCGHGRLQVLVSMSGQRVKGRLAGYSASKFALMGLCQSMRNEGWASGIRVTAICPSWVNTEMARSISSVDPEEMSQPEEIASLSSTLLTLPNQSVPFEIKLNCGLEMI